VNASELEFRVESGGIRFGLAAVKNVGEGAVEQIVREREANGPYSTLDEFCRRQDLHTVNKRVIESLIKCGAMDALGQREWLLDSKRLDSAIAAAQIDQKAASTGQVSLFDMLGGGPEPVPPQGTPLSVVGNSDTSALPVSRERALWEKEVLGFQFGDHPFLEAAAWLAGQVSHDTSQLTAELGGERVKIAGLVTDVRRIMTKTRSQMAVLMIEDLHGTIEAVVFPRVYERGAELWREDAILVLEGKVDSRSDRTQLVVDRAEEWTRPANGTPPPRVESNGSANAKANGKANGSSNGSAHSRSPSEPARPENSPPTGGELERRVLRVVVPRGDDDGACLRVLEQLHGLVTRFPGSDEIHLFLHDRAGGRIELAGADIPVRHSADLESQVRTLVGADNLDVSQPMARVAPTSRGAQ
jgi:DNA polymerase-3 subunit alpha